jgi:hypothetical protein
MSVKDVNESLWHLRRKQVPIFPDSLDIKRKQLPCAGWAFLATGIADTAMGTADTATGTADMGKSGTTF